MTKTKAPARTINPLTETFDFEKMEICDDPLPAARAKPALKYEARFKAMKIGQALKVPSSLVNNVSGSMRKFIAENDLDAHSRTMQVYPGDKNGLGRVWMMPGRKSIRQAIPNVAIASPREERES